MKDLQEAQNWVKEFNNECGWMPDECSAFEMMNYLTEEVGELARAIRTIEVGRNRPDEPIIDDMAEIQLIEEMGDVLGALIGITNHYCVSLEEVLITYQTKMMNRYKKGIK